MYTNRLIHEKSLYLLQHAHNPVDWYPWGEEAFNKAKELDRPIFLSIGYATCHWCHVMAEESFSDPKVADLLNKAFVNIKVDREELPQVDSMYMELSQGLMGSSSGWPLNIVLTPDLKPFFAVTYLPKEARPGLTGFPQMIEEIEGVWNSEEKPKLIEQAEKLVDTFSALIPTAGEAFPKEESLHKAAVFLYDIFDPLFGGFKGDPKFPLSYHIEFLLHYGKAHSDSRALFLAELTLDSMAKGGIYDHLGGGFSHYSIDSTWQVPHFEKMLYDNALLASAYVEGYRVSSNPKYKKIAAEIFGYLLREMQGAEGGFYSSEDADVKGIEGGFYTWTFAEIQEILPSSQLDVFCACYGISLQGNFEGRNVLREEIPLDELSLRLNMPKEELEKGIEEGRKILFEKRKERDRPIKDRKVLSSWNGLIIDALIKGSSVLQNTTYRDAAKSAIECIKKYLWKDGALLRRYCDNEARFSAGLDEYAFLIKGALTLFESGEGASYLAFAMQMAEILERDFLAENGAFYQTNSQDFFLMRKCELYDGAEPSGNGVHAENLLRLYQITGHSKYLERAQSIFKVMKMLLEVYAPGVCYHLLGLEKYYAKEAVTLWIALDESRGLEGEIRAHLSKHKLSHLTTIWKPWDDEELFKLIPLSKERVPLENRTTLYVLHDGKNREILSDQESIMTLLRGFYE